MDIQKYQLTILCLSLFPLSVTGQEWGKQDSLKLQQMLDSEQEIKINRKLIEATEQGAYSPKPITDFDLTLPTIKSSTIFSKPSTNIYNILHKPSISTFAPTYSLLRINKNLILHSKSNFAESSNNFHIQTLVEYKFSKKWSLNIYGTQNLNTQKHRGLPSEVEPTQLGSNIILKINKNWKIKTGMQYQYNAIRKRWEWIPQISVSYEW
ncbi:DUF4858 domain-containing protein [uncultured Bacteroides sp.]|uniref:DUF4858 domain-containing protein n=1 Tax=uncultured Bacteroides sp. TaxID=162156 RepID=UPI0025D25FF9|nr:DUF4858 domain-containing protein [uncultured Bacteroides sp.]